MTISLVIDYISKTMIIEKSLSDYGDDDMKYLYIILTIIAVILITVASYLVIVMFCIKKKESNSRSKEFLIGLKAWIFRTKQVEANKKAKIANITEDGQSKSTGTIRSVHDIREGIKLIQEDSASTDTKDLAPKLNILPKLYQKSNE